MKPIIKNGLLIAGGALIVSSILGFKKYEKAKAIFDQMDIVPNWVSKINLSWDRLKFSLDIKLINNSNDDLFVTGSGVAELKQVIIFFKNNYLATANVSLSEISIPSKNVLIVKGIPIEVNTGTALSNASSFLNVKLSDFTIIGIVEAFGTTYKIGEE
jgi:hypothetical protein